MIHLDLQPEVEAQLAAEARARGITVNSYLQQIFAAHIDQAAEASPHDGMRQALDQLHRGEG